MFNLLSNCCNWVSKFQQPIRKVTVLMVGLDNAGKTSTIKGILKESPRDLGPTSGCVHRELRVDNFLVTLLDVGGGQESRRAWRDYYGEAHGIVFVVDSSDGQRVPEARELLMDMLKQPKVARKPLLLLANKQDKMDALLVSELTEALSLEKLVNQSQSLCHIEPCSALVDQCRWSDRKALWGLRWLLRAVCLDYAELCDRLARDSKCSGQQGERERCEKPEKGRGKSRDEKIHTSRMNMEHREELKEKEKKAKNSTGGKLQPIQNSLKMERILKKNMKKKQVTVEGDVNSRRLPGWGGEEVGFEEAVPDQRGGKEEESRDALFPRKRGRTKHKVKKGTKETPEVQESKQNEGSNEKKGKGEKKKTVNVRKKNKIKSEDMPAAYSQPADLSANFYLYRKAILALKPQQQQNK